MIASKRQRVSGHFAAKTLLATTVISASLAISSVAWAGPKVVTSIKPIHGIAAAIMKGVGTPDLIVTGAGSPHDVALKPSQAQMLQDADVVFWVGPALEGFLTKPVESIAADGRAVELIETAGLTLLPFREDGAFEAHDHDHGDHDEHAHDEHDHDEHDEHAHDEHDDDEHDEHAHDEHDHEGGIDPHIWLDPHNAEVIANKIAETLAKIDPENSDMYWANAAALDDRLHGLMHHVEEALEPVHEKRFIVFHYAYHYFENRFHMKAAGSVTVSPETMPGAARLKEIKHKIEELGVVCVFSEPQFPNKLVTVVAEGSGIRKAELDPLGAAVEDGPELYFELIENMAAAMRSCLSEAS